MYLPMKYQNDEGSRVCGQCGKKFTIPEDDLTEYVNVCEECGPKLEQQYKAAEIKAAENAETQKQLDAALGK